MPTKRKSLSIREKIDQVIEERGLDKKDEPLMLPDAVFDEAIIGLTKPCAGTEGKVHVIYDFDKLIRLTMRHNKCSYEDAMDWHEGKTTDVWMGSGTPIFVNVIKHN